MRRIGIFGAMIVAALALQATAVMASSGVQAGNGQPLQVGPYLVQVTLSQDPPGVGQSFTVSLISHDNLSLTGRLIAQPENGTDATPIHANLSEQQGQPGTLVGNVSLSVRGKWLLVFYLNGPQGNASASLPVTAQVPYDMPAWLGWLIGLVPFALFVWWLWRQGRYRRRLLTHKSQEQAGQLEQAS